MSDIDEEYMREQKELHRWKTDSNAGMERMAELRCDPTVDPDLISGVLRREHDERQRHRHEDSLMFAKRIYAPNHELWVRCTQCDYEERAGEIEAREF